MPGKFNFTVFGGLEKEHYKAFRQLREKYDLTDRGLIECMIEFCAAGGLNGHEGLAYLAAKYKVTAPVDAAPLPEVV
jgi:hypothetical protein